jgi:hypothetical protein
MPFDTGYRRSPADHRDWSYRERALSGAQAYEITTLPSRYRVDARTPLPVYEQQGPSCVGWGTATAQTAMERKDKRRTVLHDGAEFYSHVALPGGGAYPRDALKLWRDRGVLTESGKPHRIAGFAAVNPRDHDAVRHAIYAGRGICIGFAVTHEWAQGGGKEFDATDAQGDEVLGGHWMYVPGYEQAGPEGLNTWGRTWARNGRATLPWAYWNRHVWECWTIIDVND